MQETRSVRSARTANAALDKDGDAPDWLRAWGAAMLLSPREREVMALVIRGLRNKEVAGLLTCSELTVRNHLCSVFRKVGVSTRAELTFLALGEGAERCA